MENGNQRTKLCIKVVGSRTRSTGRVSLSLLMELPTMVSGFKIREMGSELRDLQMEQSIKVIGPTM